MKKYILIILTILTFSTKISFAGPLYGKGELKMSPKTVNNFISYIKINKEVKNAKPDSFIISSNGDWSWFWYCGHNECWSDDKPTLEKCERMTGVTCGRFAKRRTIFWDNGINNKKNRAKFSSKMSDQEIRDKLKEYGFIKVDEVEQTKKKSENNSDIAKQLNQIKKLFDDGVLTKEEFEKAKKKILN